MDNIFREINHAVPQQVNGQFYERPETVIPTDKIEAILLEIVRVIADKKLEPMESKVEVRFPEIPAPEITVESAVPASVLFEPVINVPAAQIHTVVIPKHYVWLVAWPSILLIVDILLRVLDR